MLIVPVTVGFSGAEASFSAIATKSIFKETHHLSHIQPTLQPMKSFNNVFNALEGSLIQYALFPIENSLTGINGPVQSRIAQSGAKIVAEWCDTDELFLMALPGSRIEDITEIKSHLLVYERCSNFLDSFDGNFVVSDTASAAMEITEKSLGHWYVIAYIVLLLQVNWPRKSMV